MSLAAIINRPLPTDPPGEFSQGEILSLLVAARLPQPVAVESGADLLGNIPPKKLNGERRGKSLHAFFTQRHSILTSLALHVAPEFSVSLHELHYDPTHILLPGADAQSESRGQTPQGEAARR